MDNKWANRKKLHKSYNSKSNVIKINTNNSFIHEVSKFYLCWCLAKENQDFVTEAIFENGSRADIYVIDSDEAFEVLHTETDAYFESKKTKYPCKVIGFKTDKLKEKILKLL